MKASKRRSSGAPASDSQPREIELKLELASGSVDDLLTHPVLAQACPLPRQSGHLHAVYFDTDDQDLRRAGISLRIRCKNGHAIQTVKADAEERGLAMNRGEWETPVDGTLDFAAIEHTPLASLLPDEAARHALKPVFTIETDRRTFLVEQEGSLIEVSLDRTEASSAARSMPFTELELELKHGEPAALFTFARRLSAAVPLRLALVPKSERGYRLLEDDAPRPVRAGTIKLPKGASCAEAFQIIARNCLSQIVLNESLMRQNRHPEALHQMRVGLRRLRAALSLFRKQLLADSESAEIREALRAIGRPMGETRDLDVLLERLETMENGAPVPSDLERIQLHRDRAYEALRDMLEDPAFMSTILHIAAWIEAGAWSLASAPEQQEAREHSAKAFAADELSRRWKRIRKSARHLREVDDADRHALRIRIKKLRYGAEFFRSLFPSDKARRRCKKLLRILEKLQELLGQSNDLSISHALIPSLPTLTPKAIDKRRRKLLDKAETAARKLDRIKPFWR